MATDPLRLVLVGGGGHASDVLQVIEALRSTGRDIDVVGVLDDAPIDERRFAGRGVHQIGTLTDLNGVDAQYVLCLGWPATRSRVAAELRAGEAAPPLIHPRADVGVGVDLGAGSVVLGNAHVSPMVRLGEHSLVSYNATIGHDTRFGAFATVMPNAAVSGDVEGGDRVLVGSGAVVREGLSLGDDARVGAGAAVVTDVPRGATVVGVPARPIR